MSANFSELHEKLLNSKKDVSFAYLYEIFLPSGEVLSLSSSNDQIGLDDKIFFPFSGVNIEKGEFNDSAENIITLRGIFDKRAICKKKDFTGCRINIYIYVDSISTLLVSYFITEYEKNDLDFRLKCEPESVKYNQSLLLLFSTTCRANFGDTKCGIDLNRYKKTYKIKDIESSVIMIENMDRNSGYYNLGRAFFSDTIETVSFKIISHHENYITLDQAVSEHLLKQEEVKLVVACDKKFRTCCNKFNNAVNFRGEPTINQNHFLKNNA